MELEFIYDAKDEKLLFKDANGCSCEVFFTIDGLGLICIEGIYFVENNATLYAHYLRFGTLTNPKFISLESILEKARDAFDEHKSNHSTFKETGFVKP